MLDFLSVLIPLGLLALAFVMVEVLPAMED